MAHLETAVLTEHVQGCRRLALRLVFDVDRAEDVSQDALVALLALRQPPRKSRGAWLTGTTRKVAAQRARTAMRRLARERRAARPERTPATVDVVARLEQQRRVAAAVAALAEPYRTAVYRRFYDGLKPSEIAAQLHAPVETVKTRIKRGLAMLRTQLDETTGGDRQRWRAGFLPLLALDAVPTATTTAAATGVGSWLLWLVPVVSGGLLLWWVARDRDEALPPAPAEVATKAVSPDAPRLHGASDRHVPLGDTPRPPSTREERWRRFVDGLGKAEVRAPRDWSDRRVVVRGVVRDVDGAPLAGCPVRLVLGQPAPVPKARPVFARAQTDAEGRFECAAPGPGQYVGRFLTVAAIADHPVHVQGLAVCHINLDEQPESGDIVQEGIVIRMREAFDLEVVVRDAGGDGVADATCSLFHVERDLSGRIQWPDGRPLEGTTDAEGVLSWRLPQFPDDLHGHHMNAGTYVLVHKEGYPPAVSAFLDMRRPQEATGPYRAMVVLRRGSDVAGRVVDAAGAPVADYVFDYVRGSRGPERLIRGGVVERPVRTDAQGRFCIAGVPAGDPWTFAFVYRGFHEAPLRAAAGTNDAVVRVVLPFERRLVFRDATTWKPLRVTRYAVESPQSMMGGSGTGDHILEIDESAPGPHDIEVFIEGRATPFRTRVTLDESSPELVVVEVPAPAQGHVVAGTIQVTGDATPAELSGFLEPVDVPGDESEEDSEVRCNLVFEGLTFRIVGVPAGTYRLLLDADNVAEHAQELVVGPSTDHTALSVPMSPGATLLVLLAAPPPAATWKPQVRVRYSTGDNAYAFTPVVKGDTHRYTFRHAPAGDTLVAFETSTYSLQLHDDDPHARRVTLRDGATTVVDLREVPITFARGRIAGHTARESNRVRLRRVGVGVAAKDLDPTWMGSKRTRVAADGTFAFEGLVPGRYALIPRLHLEEAYWFEVAPEGVGDLVLTR